MELFEDPDFLNAQQKMKKLVSVVSIKESVKTMLKASPKKFFCIFFFIMIPLSFLQFFLETNNLAVAIVIGDLYYDKSSSPESLLPYKQIIRAYSSVNLYLKLNSIQYCVFLILFFPFYFLSISVTTVTVASLYLSKPLSCISILSTVPRILRRLAITFLHVLPLILLNYIAYLVVFTLFCTILTLICSIPKINHVLVVVIGIIFAVIYFSFILFVHGRFIAWCNFANVVSVLEPNIYGSAAIKKSKQLLQEIEEKKFIPSALVPIYLDIVYQIVSVANLVMWYDMNIMARILICSLFVLILAVVNFLGLTAQNLMYYQNQVLDKGVSNECVSDTKKVSNDNRVEGIQLEV